MCSTFPAAMASRRSGRIMLRRQILALTIVIGHRKRAIMLRITAATYISTRRSRNRQGLTGVCRKGLSRRREDQYEETDHRAGCSDHGWRGQRARTEPNQK